MTALRRAGTAAADQMIKVIGTLNGEIPATSPAAALLAGAMTRSCGSWPVSGDLDGRFRSVRDGIPSPLDDELESVGNLLESSA
jgi:hypothetical protein